MIKIEIMTLSTRKGSWSAEAYQYIKKWVQQNSSRFHFKLHPNRQTIVFYDQKTFEHFKDTFKQPWRRIY